MEVHRRATNDADLVWDAELHYAVAPSPSGNTPQPAILSVGVDAEGSTLDWSAIVGRRYRVQRSVDFSSWSDISPLITATSPTERFTDAALLTHGFYRVLLVD